MLEEKINELENVGREKFRKLCETKKIELTESTNPFEHFDATIFYKGKKYLIEIKDRSGKFNYDTILFEKEKYDNLKRAIEKENADGAYYVSFFDNIAYIYHLPIEIDIAPSTINANKCTAINDDKKEKTVYFIPKSSTKILEI